MRILIVSPVGTHPVTAGNKKIILQYASLFSEWGHDVYLLHICSHAFKKNGREKIYEECIETHNKWQDHYIPYYESWRHKLRISLIKLYRSLLFNGYTKCDDFYPSNLHKFINRIDKNYHFDACIVNYYMYSKLLDYIHIRKKALFTHDFFSFKDLVVGLKAGYATTPNEEAKALKRAPFIFAMQEEEAHFFQRLSPTSRILINYSNFQYHSQPIIGNHNILFLSGRNIYNINGIKWFISEIFPHIIECFPDTKLVIGGGICQELTSLMSSNNIELYGFVDDIDKFFRMGDIAINPTYQGTGLKIKTFESIAYDKATIVHPHSIIGIYKKESSPLFVTDKFEGWLDALKYLWSDRKNIEKIKHQNKTYILDMNRYIKSQYECFLNSK